jgi:transketolase
MNLSHESRNEPDKQPGSSLNNIRQKIPVHWMGDFKLEDLNIRHVGLVTLRPGDSNEVVEAYRYMMQLRNQPAVLVLSRQSLPTLDRSKYAPASGMSRGAYVLDDAPEAYPEIILIGIGCGLSLAVMAHEKLCAEGILSRLVSMPSWDIFEQQPKSYRESVLPPDVEILIMNELTSTFGWEGCIGTEGREIGIKKFGFSAPLNELHKNFRFEPNMVVTTAKEKLKSQKSAA